MRQRLASVLGICCSLCPSQHHGLFLDGHEQPVAHRAGAPRGHAVVEAGLHTYLSSTAQQVLDQFRHAGQGSFNGETEGTQESRMPTGFELTRSVHVHEAGTGLGLQISNCSEPVQSGKVDCMLKWGDTLKIKVAPRFSTPVEEGAWFELKFKPIFKAFMSLNIVGVQMPKLQEMLLKCPMCGGLCNLTVQGMTSTMRMWDCPLPQGQELDLFEFEFSLPHITDWDSVFDSFTDVPGKVVAAMPTQMMQGLPTMTDLRKLSKTVLGFTHGMGFDLHASMGRSEYDVAPLWKEHIHGAVV